MQEIKLLSLHQTFSYKVLFCKSSKKSSHIHSSFCLTRSFHRQGFWFDFSLDIYLVIRHYLAYSRHSINIY